MRIENTNSITFSGLWEPVTKRSKETGAYNINKVFYTLKELVYHPYVDESPAAIEAEVNKYFWGRSFSVWDKFDGHRKNDTIQMNYVKVGEAIKHEDKEAYLAQNYSETPVGSILEDKEFWETYNNGAYVPYDDTKMPAERVKELAAKHFDIKA